MKMEFHHIGIPTTQKQPNEIYLEGAKLYVTDATKSEHKIEWLRFEAGSPMHYLVKKTAHVAYTVNNLEAALAGKKVIIQPFDAMEGLRVAFIQDGDAPIEYMQFTK
jgi:hypothetical protein